MYDAGKKTPDRTLRWAMRAISEGLSIDEDAGTEYPRAAA